MVSPKGSELMAARLRAHGKTNYSLLRYPGAGHVIEPPHTPVFHEAASALLGKRKFFAMGSSHYVVGEEIEINPLIKKTFDELNWKKCVQYDHI